MSSLYKKALFLALAVLALRANAYVECTFTPTSVYVDNGQLYVPTNLGSYASALMTDSATKYYYATATMALTTAQQVTVRFPDGATCSSGTWTIMGITLR